MKKLMIAAAAAAMVGGAYAGCSDVYGCLVYDYKVTLKTLGCKTLTCKGTCTDGAVEYYDNVTRTLQGYAWTCDYDCACDGTYTGTESDKFNFILWEPKAKLAWGFYDATAKATDQTFSMVDLFLRYGKTGTKCAIKDPLNNKFTFVGTDWNAYQLANCSNAALLSSTFIAGGELAFGAVNGSVGKISGLNACAVKSISGYTMGTVNADIRCTKSSSSRTTTLCSDTITVCCADKAPLYACICNCNIDWCTAQATIDLGDTVEPDYFQNNVVPAVGTWTMKYNGSLSKGKTAIASKIPTYAQK